MLSIKENATKWAGASNRALRGIGDQITSPQLLNRLNLRGLQGFLPYVLQVSFFGSEQEFVGASPFIGFLSMGLFVSHGWHDWRARFAGLFRDRWSLSGTAGIARPPPASGRRASGTGWNAMPVSEIPSRLTGDSRTGQPALL